MSWFCATIFTISMDNAAINFQQISLANVNGFLLDCY